MRLHMKYKGTMFLLFTATLLGGASLRWTIGQTTAVSSGSGTRTLVPHSSWNCGMAEGIPAPENGTLVFEAKITLDTVLNVGRTPYGDRRVAIAREGSVSGARLSGTVTSGALDFELKLPNGVIEIEQILVLKTSDGKYI